MTFSDRWTASTLAIRISQGIMSSQLIGKLWLSVCLTLLSVGCNAPLVRHHGDEVLFKRFKHALQPPPGKENCGRYEIDLAQVTPFAWDNVYYFLGETGPDAISSIIGFTWKGPAVPNLYRRLLFVRQHKVISYIDCPQDNDLELGEVSMEINMFHCQATKPMLSRNQAKFITSHIPRKQSRFFYPLIPLSCLPNFEGLLAAPCLIGK
jgi:hypothetical protein